MQLSYRMHSLQTQEFEGNYEKVLSWVFWGILWLSVFFSGVVGSQCFQTQHFEGILKGAFVGVLWGPVDSLVLFGALTLRIIGRPS
jgi:hypothetical protein